MKTNFLAVCLIVVSVATIKPGYAKSNDDDNTPAYTAVISDFIYSYINSDYKKLNNILSDDACVKIPRMEKVIIQNKASLVKQMREDSGVKQSCSGSYEIIAKSDGIIIARVDFQYSDFKQHNFIVMEKDGSKKWKITEVCKLSENTDTKGADPQNVIAVNR